MRTSYRIPIAVLGGAAIIAAVLALKPASVTVTPGAPDQAQAANAATDPGALIPYLRFTGFGSVTVQPDTAGIYVSAVGTSKTSEDALAKASAKMEKVQAKLRELGIAAEDMATGSASTYQDFESKDWRAEISLNVKVREIGRAGELLAEANAAGADAVSGPSFSVEDSRVAYASALRKAIEDARAKAEAAAAQMGVKVAGVVSVDDQSGGGGPPIFASGLEAKAADGAAVAPVPITPGTQEVGATVSVVFSYSAA